MSSPKILVVEDEPHILTLVASVAQMHGVEAAMAENGERALALAEKLPLRAAIIDFTLPDMNGLEVGTRLLALQPGLSGHLLYISGYEPAAEEEFQMAEQKAGFLSKPFELSALQNAVARLIGE